MNRRLVVPLALTASLALLGACSKPASQTAAAAGSDASATASDAAAATTTTASNAATAGGVISPPQANGAVNADGNTGSTNVAAGSNSFTEDEARGHIEHAGYYNVTGMSKTGDGMWVGKATDKSGKAMNVTVDFKGAVSAQ